jgi:hypothetical protein
MLEGVYTIPGSGLAIGIFWLIWTMAASRAATGPALEVVGGSEYEVGALKVEVFGRETRRCFALNFGGRVGLGRWTAIHASILSSNGEFGVGPNAMGRIKG